MNSSTQAAEETSSQGFQKIKEKASHCLDLLIGPAFCVITAILYAYFSATLDGGFLFVFIGFASLLFTLFFGKASFFITIPLQLIVGISQIVFDAIPILEQTIFSTCFMIGLVVTFLGMASRSKNEEKVIAIVVDYKPLFDEQNHRANELSKQIQMTLVENMKLNDQNQNFQFQMNNLQREVEISQNETIQAILLECERSANAREKLQDEIIEHATQSVFQPSDAKYKQLRDQFEEKSRILEAARKELFQANERAELLQRKLDEQLMHEPLDNEVRLLQDLQKLDASKAAMQKNYENVLISYEQLLQQILTSK